MSKTIVSEGKTTTEAIENGLKQLKTSKDKVEIKILENEDKRSFFSILAPRIVKVELTVKEEEIEKKESIKKEKVYTEVTDEDIKKGKENLNNFMVDFIKNLPEDVKYKIIQEKEGLKIEVNSDKLGYLIGYRGETLYALQTIISAIANKNVKNRLRIILDIEGYKEKREKTLEHLAQKVERTVIKTGKSVTLEPMKAYERKIIHSKLQESKKVTTKSIGEEPRRRIVISLK